MMTIRDAIILAKLNAIEETLIELGGAKIQIKLKDKFITEYNKLIADKKHSKGYKKDDSKSN